MSKSKTTLFLMLAIGVPSTALSGTKESFENANKRISTSLCQKMFECIQKNSSETQPKDKVTPEACKAQMIDLFKMAYESLPKEQRVVPEKETIDACVETIQKTSCEALLASKKLENCDWLETLNRVVE